MYFLAFLKFNAFIIIKKNKTKKYTQDNTMNLLLFFIVAILLLLQIINVNSENLKCLESNTHKPTPSEESSLHGQVN